jgi:hypothetical protein
MKKLFIGLTVSLICSSLFCERRGEGRRGMQTQEGLYLQKLIRLNVPIERHGYSSQDPVDPAVQKLVTELSVLPKEQISKTIRFWYNALGKAVDRAYAARNTSQFAQERKNVLQLEAQIDSVQMAFGKAAMEYEAKFMEDIASLDPKIQQRLYESRGKPMPSDLEYLFVNYEKKKPNIAKISSFFYPIRSDWMNAYDPIKYESVRFPNEFPDEYNSSQEAQ